ncbi:uncharacterized protein LOC127265691 [Andrographis paniculata]|uniref:uncharacterized protein LOC127265691 n=1 Tax=Andrographis paniculata TaxID=175694 RepID=UPI0021E84CA4|nr:uncharacterized protein LOC127265691 [Andrographis paniculata]
MSSKTSVARFENRLICGASVRLRCRYVKDVRRNLWYYGNLSCRIQPGRCADVASTFFLDEWLREKKGQQFAFTVDDDDVAVVAPPPPLVLEHGDFLNLMGKHVAIQIRDDNLQLELIEVLDAVLPPPAADDEINYQWRWWWRTSFGVCYGARQNHK